MDQLEQIEDAISAGSELHSTYRNDLHVTIRIAKDFYDFLAKHRDAPDGEQIDYMAGTIRSGIDEFYLLAYGCRGIIKDEANWNLDPQEQWNFPVLRERFMKTFEHLVEPDLRASERLTSLFVLTHLELVFLALYFPFAIFAESASDSMSIKESLESIRKMIGDKTS